MGTKNFTCKLPEIKLLEVKLPEVKVPEIKLPDTAKILYKLHIDQVETWALQEARVWRKDPAQMVFNRIHDEWRETKRDSDFEKICEEKLDKYKKELEYRKYRE